MCKHLIAFVLYHRNLFDLFIFFHFCSIKQLVAFRILKYPRVELSEEAKIRARHAVVQLLMYLGETKWVWYQAAPRELVWLSGTVTEVLISLLSVGFYSI